MSTNMQVDREESPSAEMALKDARDTLAGLGLGSIHLPDSLCRSEEAMWDASGCVQLMVSTPQSARAYHHKRLMALLGMSDQLRE